MDSYIPVFPFWKNGITLYSVNIMCYIHPGKGFHMVTAIVLLTVERDGITRIAEEITELSGVTEVFSVGGRFDLVAIIRVPNNERLAELVTGNLLQVKGIRTSETLIAFKVFSRHDLESMFAIGLEE
jgi:DNA-binding Lrp family transcriptional regulator